MKIGVAGITGRMGVLVAEEILAAGAELTGGLARARHAAFTDVAGLAAVSDVVIDFTQAATAAPHARALAAANCPWVLGTTGMSAADQDAIAQAARSIPIVQAANFAPGVALLALLLRQMAASLPGDLYDAEIMEMHHRQKRDAPSGTALALGRAIEAGRGGSAPKLDHSGSPGVRQTGGIGYASLRGGQVIGDHTVLFAGDGEHISIRHQALDRRIFARGAVRAALWTQNRPPGLYGMADVLGSEPSTQTLPTEEGSPQ